MNTTVQKTENEALAQVLKDNIEPQIMDFDDKQFLIAPQTAQVVDLDRFFAGHKQQPDRRNTKHALGRLDSFIAFTNRYKSDDTIVLAKGTIADGQVSASAETVFNAHPAGSDHGIAGHGDFTATYRFPISVELQKWIAGNKDVMDQEDFAHFVEDNILDISSGYIEGALDISKAVGGECATTSDMLELARGLEVRVREVVKNSARLPSGQLNLTYSTEHEGADGTPLVVPAWFTIKIPVFDGGQSVLIPVRLRYRVSGGRVSWFYELYRIEKVFAEALKASVDQITQETELPLFVVA